MPVVGAMPFLSSALASSSSGQWLLVPSQGGLPRWKAAVGGGSGKSSSNKLGFPVPELQARTLLSLVPGGYHGDGGKVQRGWIFVRWRLELDLFSPMFDGRRWRLLKFCNDGGRWPVFPSSSVTILVEGRPLLFLPALPDGRQLHHLLGGLGLLRQPRRSPRPKWSVPGAGEIQPAWMMLWTRSRFYFQFRVFSVKARGLFAFSLSLLGFVVKCSVPQL